MDWSHRDFHTDCNRTLGDSAPPRANGANATNPNATPAPSFLSGSAVENGVSRGPGPGMLSPLEVSVTVKPTLRAPSDDHGYMHTPRGTTTQDISNGHGPSRREVDVGDESVDEGAEKHATGGAWMSTATVTRFLQTVPAGPTLTRL